MKGIFVFKQFIYISFIKTGHIHIARAELEPVVIAQHFYNKNIGLSLNLEWMSDNASLHNLLLLSFVQGGPGGSGTGFGNFEEIGPIDVDQNPRNTTWVKLLV